MPITETLRFALVKGTRCGRFHWHRYAKLFTFAVLFNACSVFNANAVEEPDGYRLKHYDDTVPATLTGATRVSAVQVRQLQSVEGALVVDVIPEHRKPDDMPDGQLWFPLEHKGVSGALWLPDVGYGLLSEVTESYFADNLRDATEGDLDHAIVFYCRSDCWMSWNAAKRALSYGYTRVYWFADGIHDWEFEGYDIEVLTPAPGVRH